VGHEVGHRAVAEGLLPAAGLDQHGDPEWGSIYAGCPLAKTSAPTRTSLERRVVWAGRMALSASGISPCGNSPKSTRRCLLNWRWSLRAGAEVVARVTCEKQAASCLASRTLFIITILLSTRLKSENGRDWPHTGLRPLRSQAAPWRRW